MESTPANNVIQFPIKNLDDITTSPNDFNENFNTIRIEKASEIADEIYEIAINVLNNYGYFNNINKTNLKDLMFISEVLKSAMLRYNNIEYPLHSFVDLYFQIEGEDYPEGVDPEVYFAEQKALEKEKEEKE